MEKKPEEVVYYDSRMNCSKYKEYDIVDDDFLYRMERWLSAETTDGVKHWADSFERWKSLKGKQVMVTVELLDL